MIQDICEANANKVMEQNKFYVIQQQKSKSEQHKEELQRQQEKEATHRFYAEQQKKFYEKQLKANADMFMTVFNKMEKLMMIAYANANNSTHRNNDTTFADASFGGSFFDDTIPIPKMREFKPNMTSSRYQTGRFCFIFSYRKNLHIWYFFSLIRNINSTQFDSVFLNLQKNKIEYFF